MEEGKAVKESSRMFLVLFYLSNDSLQLWDTSELAPLADRLQFRLI